MRLLIVTQTVGADDPVLGFFIGWIREIAARSEQVHVVCLREGSYELGENVSVHSLGKERGRTSRVRYALRFLRLTWSLRREYDAVFVHMNQEYVLLSGVMWKLLGKRVYLWRNHYAGSVLTDVAVLFCDKVFCTSRSSYTARYRKTVLMPVGVDTDAYRPVPGVERAPRSILWYARVAPSKRPDLLLEALASLAREGMEFTADFYGTPLPKDVLYAEGLQRFAAEQGLGGRVRFVPGAPHAAGPTIYSAHEIFVNTSPSGMYDKTIFEAAACGCLVLASSRDFAEHADPRLSFDGSARDLAKKIQMLSALPVDERARLFGVLAGLAADNDVEILGVWLVKEMAV